MHAFGPADLSIDGRRVRLAARPVGLRQVDLMLMIAGLLEPTTGEIRVAGKPVAGRRPTSASCSRTTRWCPGARSGTTSSCSSSCAGSTLASYAERIDTLLASVRLDGFEHRHPWELSGGMQQRAAFCQAMVHEPRDAAARRAARQARRDDARRASARDLQTLWMTQQADRHLRHPLDRGGGAAFEPHLRDHAAARPHRPGHRRRPALSARSRGEEGPGVRRAMSARSRRSSMATASSDAPAADGAPLALTAFAALRRAPGCSSPSSSASSCSGNSRSISSTSPRYILPKPSEIVRNASADIPRLLYYT